MLEHSRSLAGIDLSADDVLATESFIGAGMRQLRQALEDESYALPEGAAEDMLSAEEAGLESPAGTEPTGDVVTAYGDELEGDATPLVFESGDALDDAQYADAAYGEAQYGEEAFGDAQYGDVAAEGEEAAFDEESAPGAADAVVEGEEVGAGHSWCVWGGAVCVAAEGEEAPVGERMSDLVCTGKGI